MTSPAAATRWPPDVRALKDDLGIAPEDTRDDERLRAQLAAAVAYVEQVHAGRYDFAGDASSGLPAPDADMRLGVVRLAARWHTRRRSPDGLVVAGELGSFRVPALDADIERLLRIGRFNPGTLA